MRELRFLTVMAGHSRPKDGVLSKAYVPAIHAFLFDVPKTWMPGTWPGMTTGRRYDPPVCASTITVPVMCGCSEQKYL
jgi:hypothetical protein